MRAAVVGSGVSALLEPSFSSSEPSPLPRLSVPDALAACMELVSLVPVPAPALLDAGSAVDGVEEVEAEEGEVTEAAVSLVDAALEVGAIVVVSVTADESVACEFAVVVGGTVAVVVAVVVVVIVVVAVVDVVIVVAAAVVAVVSTVKFEYSVAEVTKVALAAGAVVFGAAEIPGRLGAAVCAAGCAADELCVGCAVSMADVGEALTPAAADDCGTAVDNELLVLGTDVQEELVSLEAALPVASACSAEPIDSGVVEGSDSWVGVVAEGCAVGFAIGALLAEAAGTRLDSLPLLFLLLLLLTLLLSLPPPLVLLDDESEVAPS